METPRRTHMPIDSNRIRGCTLLVAEGKTSIFLTKMRLAFRFFMFFFSLFFSEIKNPILRTKNKLKLKLIIPACRVCFLVSRVMLQYMKY